MPGSSAVASARGALAIHARRYPQDADGLSERRAALAAARLEQYVADVLADAPPLSPAQRDRIAALLRPAATSSEVAPR